jgi:hypothetical protein
VFDLAFRGGDDGFLGDADEEAGFDDAAAAAHGAV